MQSSIKKQFFRYFVLPTGLFILAFGLACLFGHSRIQIFISLVVSLLIWGLISLILLRQILNSYDQVEAALEKLNKGEDVLFSKNIKHSYFSSFISSLSKISSRMKAQQEELQLERVERLRSMIDGQDQERQRLARELHDSIGQSLIAVKLQLENSASLSYSQVRATVDIAKGMVDQTIDEVRRVTNALMPAALSEFGLITALRTRCEELGNAAGLEVFFEHSGSMERLENKSKTYLYRIAQEAMSNIIKHARATEMKINLVRNGQEVILMIEDNGKGFIFDPANFIHRNGIQNIRERVTLLNGNFELRSEPNAGTQLRITIPYITGNGKNTYHISG